jgi:hypothetical protein
MNLTTLREEIVSALSGISGLEVTGFPPGGVNTPHAFINGMTVNYQFDSPDGASAEVELVLVISRMDDESGWLTLDEFLTPGGTRCIRDAVNAIQPVADAFDYVVCSGATQIEGNFLFASGEQTYLAVTLNVQAVG